MGPPPAPPKRVDYKRPQMTKAMLQRMKHAQKFQEDYERKERERREAQSSPRPLVRRPSRRSGVQPATGESRASPDSRPTDVRKISINFKII